MKFLENIPDILYKYRIWEDDYQKRILTDNELFFASADLFNDPFDASLPFQYDKSEMTDENIMKKLLITGRNKWQDISEDELLKRATERFKTGGFGTDEYWRNFHQQFKKDTNEKFGICSLTSKNNNLLMWSHYANAHKGFCIGFDKFELFDATQGVLGRVIYTDSFPMTPMFGDNQGASLSFLIMTKSKHWEYEDEYRITKLLAPRSIFKLNDTAIKEIVLGCRINPNSRAEIIKTVRNKSSKIKIYDSVIDDKEFKLNLVEVDDDL